jgi:hypothetical protein
LRWDVAVYSVIILRHLRLCRPCWDTVTRRIAETHFNNTNLVRRTEEYNDIVDRCCCLISFGNISDDDPLKVLTSSALCQTTAAARKFVVCTWAFLRTVWLSYSSFPSFAFSLSSFFKPVRTQQNHFSSSNGIFSHLRVLVDSERLYLSVKLRARFFMAEKLWLRFLVASVPAKQNESLMDWSSLDAFIT